MLVSFAEILGSDSESNLRNWKLFPNPGPDPEPHVYFARSRSRRHSWDTFPDRESVWEAHIFLQPELRSGKFFPELEQESLR